MTPKPGDRVLFINPATSRYGQTGRVINPAFVTDKPSGTVCVELGGFASDYMYVLATDLTVVADYQVGDWATFGNGQLVQIRRIYLSMPAFLDVRAEDSREFSVRLDEISPAPAPAPPYDPREPQTTQLNELKDGDEAIAIVLDSRGRRVKLRGPVIVDGNTVTLGGCSLRDFGAKRASKNLVTVEKVRKA